MANLIHVAILKRNIHFWNVLRGREMIRTPNLQKANLDGFNLYNANLSKANLVGASLRRSDLRNANLQEANLFGADLTNANLAEADLGSVNLSKADLTRANLSDVFLEEGNLFETILFDANLSRGYMPGADFSKAILTGADMSEANLTEALFEGSTLNSADLSESNLTAATFRNANLVRANLTGAVLYNANLNWANLTYTNMTRMSISESTFYNAVFAGTNISDIDLRNCIGIDTIQHHGSSTLGLDTIYRSQGQIPEIFLRGCGIDDETIAYIRAISGAIQYYTVFISYSHRDVAFVERLYNDLQGKGIRCWYDQYDLKGGDTWRDSINQSIKVFDKVLVVLSKDSIQSKYVQQEVEAALMKETELRQSDPQITTLFPLRIDDSIETATSKWAYDIWLERHIINFTQWLELDAYQRNFIKLITDLKQK